MSHPPRKKVKCELILYDKDKAMMQFILKVNDKILVSIREKTMVCNSRHYEIIGLRHHEPTCVHEDANGCEPAFTGSQEVLMNRTQGSILTIVLLEINMSKLIVLHSRMHWSLETVNL
jgi:hypothetical protein